MQLKQIRYYHFRPGILQKGLMCVFRAALSVISIAILFSPCYSQEPAALQQRSVQRIDGAIENFRKAGNFEALISQLQQAEGDLQVSYRAFLNSDDLNNATLSLLKLAMAQRLQQRWSTARATYQQAYDLARRAKNVSYEALALNGLVMVETDGFHDYDSAAIHVEDAIRLASGIGDKQTLFDALDLKSTIQDARTDLIGAADTMNRAHQIALEINNPVTLYYAFSDRASIYVRLGNTCDEKSGFESCFQAFDKAKSDFEQARSIVGKLGYDFLVRNMDGFLTRLEYHRQLLQSKKETAEAVTRHRIYNPTAPGQISVSERFLGRGSVLSPATKTALEEVIKKTAGDAVGYHTEGIMRLNLGQDEAASAAFIKAAELLDADRRSLREGMVGASFLEDKIQIYYDPMLDFLDHRRYSEAFDLLERSKSRAMADLLRSQELKLKSPAERKSYADSVNIDANISSLQKQLFNLRNTGASREQMAGIEREIQKFEAERQNLSKGIVGQKMKLQELVAPRTVSLAQLQQAMRPDNFEVLTYVVLTEQVVLWHISGEAVNVRSVALPRAELIRKITSLRQSLTEANVKFDQQTAREMFLFLIQPALQWIKTDHLVIIPHDDLNYIPFQVFQNPTDNQFLGERFQLSYAPNATTLLQLKKAGSIRGGRLLAAADPGIVEAQDEVEAIGKLHSGHNKIVSNVLIDEASLKGMVSNYNLIHLSVHGQFNPQEPLLSHLKLSKSGTDDGMLTAAEMFGLPLAPNSLVVLSACDTGQAQATRANEVLGMVRALLYAGADNLILSSWSVDAASTAMWMETFYREAESKPLSEAARLALLAVKKNPQYSHPYYWSPFLLIGK